jgi:hypothetical protein
MEAMDSIKDLDAALNNWIKSGEWRVGTTLVDSVAILGDLGMPTGAERELKPLRERLKSLAWVVAAFEGAPEAVVVAAKRAADVMGKFTVKAANPTELVGVMLAFQLLKLTALQAAYLELQNPGTELAEFFEGI